MHVYESILEFILFVLTEHYWVIWVGIIGLNAYNLRKIIRNRKGISCKWLIHKPVLIGINHLPFGVESNVQTLFYKCSRCNMKGFDPVRDIGSKGYIMWGIRRVRFSTLSTEPTSSDIDNVRVWKLHDRKI